MSVSKAVIVSTILAALTTTLAQTENDSKPLPSIKLNCVKHDNGTCVTKDECLPPACPIGKVYTECGSACPTTCENKDDTCRVCTLQCVPGCFCAEGTVLAPNGCCVPPKKCPPRTCTGPNEVFDPCPPTCPRTENCSNLWSKIPCTPVDCCTPQCRCKSGFFRNEANKCVSAQECMGITGGSVAASPDEAA